MRKLLASIAVLLALASPARADFKLNLRYPATVGIQRQGLLSQSTLAINTLSWAPNETGNTSWLEWYSNTANSSGSRGDHVRISGWNCAAGGGLQVSAALKGAMCDSFEQFYITGGGAKVMETHRYYVDPAGTQTRYMSVLGNLESPYGLSLYLNAPTAIVMGIGNNNNAPPSVNLVSNASQFTSPSGYRYILLNDDSGDPSVTIKNGDSGNATRGSIKIASDGQLTLNTIAQGFFQYNGATVMNWNSGATQLYLQSDSTYNLSVDGNGVYLKAGNGAGTAQFQVRASYNYSFQRMLNVDGAEASPAYAFQADAGYGMWKNGGFLAFSRAGQQVLAMDASIFYMRGKLQNLAGGALLVEGNDFGLQLTNQSAKGTCDSGHRGSIYYQAGGAGVADVFYVCSKSAADAYAWRDIAAPTP